MLSLFPIMKKKPIVSSLQSNEEKIYHHGKGADAIVKGMLEHSRTSTGIKESTDINTLVGDYLRLVTRARLQETQPFRHLTKILWIH